MSTIHVSATELKKNISTILNDVSFGGKTAVIERHGKEVAKIIPADKPVKKKKNIKALLDKYYGLLPDFPEGINDRSSLKTKENYQAFKSAAGSWKDIDTDKLVKNIYETRKHSNKPPLPL